MVNETSDRPKLTPKGARTRARIVEEAAALIHERGVAGTTLDDVKAAAEVSGSQLYHYFPDKNELVQAVIDYQAETIVKHHRKALGNVTCAERPRATHSRTPRVSSEHQRTQPSITARGELTRTRIITTASRLMMTNGAATSLDQVNAEARVSRSQIYHYFADKNALISAVLTYQCGLVLAAHEAALQALVSTGDIVGWREFVIQAFQSRSCETGYLPASLWGELASESNEHQDIIRTMYVRWGLALSQSFERVHSNEPVLRLPDVSMFGLAASTVLHGGFGLSAIHGDVRPLEEALEIMLQV